MLIVAFQLPISASSQYPLPAVLSKDNSDSTLMARHFRALPHHKLDQRATPHQQIAILCTAQNLQQHLHYSPVDYMSSLRGQVQQQYSCSRCLLTVCIWNYQCKAVVQLHVVWCCHSNTSENNPAVVCMTGIHQCEMTCDFVCTAGLFSFTELACSYYAASCVLGCLIAAKVSSGKPICAVQQVFSCAT